MSVYVISAEGKPLMPTSDYRCRRLLKSSKAVIHQHRPFTIRLTRTVSDNVQPIEYCCDTGYRHIGVSIKSEKHEYVDAQFDMLPDEKERHDKRRKYRRNRRSRLRHRKPRFDNRTSTKKKGWLPPSLENVKNQHIRIFERYAAVMPITSATFEMGSFDVHAIHEFEATGTVLSGEGYQKGPRYGMDSLRKAIFYRDGYKCQVCGRTAEKGAILRAHHLGYRNGDHSSRSGNLITVCTGCHTAANHKPGGKLYDLKARTKPLKGAAFMNAVRKQMTDELKERHPDVSWHETYGAATQEARRARSLAKSHANDAYAMGSFHPAHRTPFAHYKKLRRNGRVLERFYDAKYVDTRDGKQRNGSELSSGRTNRSESRLSERSLQMYRGQKTRKGRRSIRRSRYPLRPGDTVITETGRHRVKGIQHYGEYVSLDDGTSVAVRKVRKVIHAGGYVRIG